MHRVQLYSRAPSSMERPLNFKGDGPEGYVAESCFANHQRSGAVPSAHVTGRVSLPPVAHMCGCHTGC